jgi:hypothetical protein
MFPLPSPETQFKGLGVGTICCATYAYITTWYARLANPTQAQTKLYRLVSGVSVYGFPVFVLAAILL